MCYIILDKYNKYVTTTMNNKNIDKLDSRLIKSIERTNIMIIKSVYTKTDIINILKS